MIQVYHGDGKGKTTAAVGLAVRAAGHNIPVLFAQFLKDDTSGEIGVIRQIKNIETLHPSVFHGFVSRMTKEQLEETREDFRRMLHEVKAWTTAKTPQENDTQERKQEENAQEKADICVVVVLDEILHAMHYGLLSEEDVLAVIKAHTSDIEWILTGRNPSETILKIADYVSEIKCVKHPYEHGIPAREGIEY